MRKGFPAVFHLVFCQVFLYFQYFDNFEDFQDFLDVYLKIPKYLNPKSFKFLIPYIPKSLDP